jgi:hypothetical protein
MIRTAVVAVTWLTACAHLTPTLEVDILFRDTRGLAVGSEVRLGETRIGEVRSLEKHGEDVVVGVVIDERHRDRITAHASFRVERAGLLSSDRYLAVQPGSGAAARDGTRFRGEESLADRITGWVKKTAAWLTNPELRAQVTGFEAAVRDAASRGGDALEQARPELEERAAKLVELAREHGPEVANKMKDVVEEILEAAQ